MVARSELPSFGRRTGYWYGVKRGVIVVLFNKQGILSVGALGVLMVVASSAHAGALAPQKSASKQTSRMSLDQGKRMLAERSARFLENKGQWDSHARFLARSSNLNVWYTDRGIRYDQYAGAVGQKAKGQVVDMYFVGGGTAKPIGRKNTGSRTDIFHGKVRVVNAQSYRELYSADVLPGVDMRSYFDRGRPRYDLIVAPGTSPSRIALGFKGASGLKIEKGGLKIGTRLGSISNEKPVAYQILNGKRVAVAASWKLNGKSVAGFTVGKYDPEHELVIDPLVYGSYYGGDSGPDEVRAVVADTDGGAFLVGSSASPDFPAIYGPYNDSFNPNGRDAFVSRLRGDAYAHDYAALIGGAGTDVAQYVKIDQNNDIWVAGTTSTANGETTTSFPNSTIIGTNSQGANIFVTRFQRSADTILNPIANIASVIFATGNGGNPTNFLTGFDVRKAGGVGVEFALTGVTTAALPTSMIPNNDINAGHSFQGHRVGYLSRVRYQDGVGFTVDTLNSQYVQGTRVNEARGVALDNLGNAYIVGTVYKDPNNLNVDTSTASGSLIFKTTIGVFAQTVGGYFSGRQIHATDTFIRKYNSTGSILFSGLIGGIGDDEAGGISTTPFMERVYTGNAIALDPSGNAYITGTARSFNFPRTSSAWGETFDSNPTIYVTKISATGNAILYSTNLRFTSAVVQGQAAQMYAPWEAVTATPAGIAVDARGDVAVTGNLRANSIAWPSTAGDPNEPTGYTLPAIWLPPSSNKAEYGAVPDRTYSSPAAPEFPTTEGFITVLNPTGTNYLFTSYLGGQLDDMAFAPYMDSFGDVWAMGWTDSTRLYFRVNAAQTTVNQRFQNGNLPNGIPASTDPEVPAEQLINALAFKATPDASGFSFGPISTFGYGVWGGTGQATPPFVPTTGNPPTPGFGRDGFVTRFRVGQPALSGMTITPTVVPGGLGASTAGTVTLSTPVPSGGGQIELDIVAGSEAASLDPNSDVTTQIIDVAQGTTSLNFNVYTKGVTANTTVRVRATYVGTFKEATFNVVPWLQSMKLAANSMVGGAPGGVRGTVNLVSTALQDTTIALSTSPTDLGTFTTLVIPAGQSSGQFVLDTVGVETTTDLQVNATLLGVTKSDALELTKATLASLTFNPNPVAGGSDTTATVALTGKAGPSGYSATISSLTPGFTGMTGTVTINPQTSSGTVVLTSPVPPADTTADFTAHHEATPSYPTADVAATLTVEAFGLDTFTLDPGTVASGGTSTGTVTLNSAAPTGGVRVYVSASTSDATFTGLTGTDSIGSYILIPEGATSAEFTVKAGYVGTDTDVAITVQRSTGGAISKTLTIQAQEFTATLNPSSVIGSTSGSTSSVLTVTIPNAAPVDLTFDLTTSNPTLVPLSANSITIPANQTSASLTLHPGAVTTPTDVVIGVSFKGGAEQEATLTVRPVGLASITATPTVIRGNRSTLLVVTFEAPAPGGTLTLSSTSTGSNKVFNLPKTYTVPVGATSMPIQLLSNRVTLQTKVTIIATYNGTTATTSVTVTR